MSVEKTQLLLRLADELRLKAQELAEVAGIPERYHQFLHIPRPVKREEMLLLFACALEQERPGYMLPILNVMPEPAPGLIQKAAHHKPKKTKGKKGDVREAQAS